MMKTIRRGLSTHVVQGGWAVNPTVRMERLTRTRYDVVDVETVVDHHQDTYVTYGADPSLPDAVRPMDTYTRVDRHSWSETSTHSESVARSEETMEEVVRHDVVMDDGTVLHGVTGRLSGDRVYVVTTRRLGVVHAPEWYSATLLDWQLQTRSRYTHDLARRIKSPPYALPHVFAAMRRAVGSAIADDMRALQETLDDVDPSGLDIPVGSLRCVDGVARVQKDTVSLHYAGMRISGPQRGGCTFRDGDLLFAVLPGGGDPGTRLAALYNPRTGGTWVNDRGTTRPGVAGRLAGARFALAAAIGAVAGAAIGSMMGRPDVGTVLALAFAVLGAWLWHRSGAEHAHRAARADRRLDEVREALRIARRLSWNHLATRAMRRLEDAA